ncbi:MAG: hypothetical protein WBO39_03120 [Ferruginibacter sp.]
MKHLLYLLFGSALMYSCQKEPGGNALLLAEDDGCIERIYTPVTAHEISSTNILTADSLLDAHNINRSNLRYVRYSNDSVQTFFPPFVKYDEKIVVADQYYRGVWVFGKDILYYFKNNVYELTNGTLTNGTTFDTSINLNLRQLRKLFEDDNILYDGNGGTYKDSCYTAEFGFCNINAGTGNPEEKLVKAWKLSIKGRSPSYTSDVPIGYYQDADGKRIWYFNGIMTVR